MGTLSYHAPSWMVHGPGAGEFQNVHPVGSHAQLGSMPYAQPLPNAPHQLLYPISRSLEAPFSLQILPRQNCRTVRTATYQQRQFWGPYHPCNANGTAPFYCPSQGEVPRSEPRAGLRGPPCKPKRSGNALWVGRIPTGATVMELKDHFSRGAATEIESVFFMPKSNCAFVNYRSELACVAAMKRFHDSPFHGVRLVCQLRKDSSAIASTATTFAEKYQESPPFCESPTQLAKPAIIAEPSTPTIVDSSSASYSSPTSSVSGRTLSALNSPERYFIVKSFTKEELEASLKSGLWIPQFHIASALDRAYKEADNVYLIFSVNKSGEFFGYAKMVSPVTNEPTQTPSPLCMTTAATDTAPKGRIVDDVANETIFWEAESSEDDETKYMSQDKAQFEVKWMSAAPLPFFRTHGLRNPWNYNLPVKVARDGTELHPKAGKALLQMLDKIRRKTG